MMQRKSTSTTGIKNIIKAYRLIRAKASRDFWTLAGYLLKYVFWIIFNPPKSYKLQI